jgi:hypothetical protein
MSLEDKGEKKRERREGEKGEKEKERGEEREERFLRGTNSQESPFSFLETRNEFQTKGSSNKRNLLNNVRIV